MSHTQFDFKAPRTEGQGIWILLRRGLHTGYSFLETARPLSTDAKTARDVR